MGDSELEAAARGSLTLLRDLGGMTPGTREVIDTVVSMLDDALPQPPVPLQVGDTVTRDDAEREFVGWVPAEKWSGHRDGWGEVLSAVPVGWEVLGDQGSIWTKIGDKFWRSGANTVSTIVLCRLHQAFTVRTPEPSDA